VVHRLAGAMGKKGGLGQRTGVVRQTESVYWGGAMGTLGKEPGEGGVKKLVPKMKTNCQKKKL